MSHIFFFNDTATTEIYTLSLHDALPICTASRPLERPAGHRARTGPPTRPSAALTAANSAWLRASDRVPFEKTTTTAQGQDRKSTRLNSSHANISYAVFCLKKKNIIHFPY